MFDEICSKRIFSIAKGTIASTGCHSQGRQRRMTYNSSFTFARLGTAPAGLDSTQASKPCMHGPWHMHYVHASRACQDIEIGASTSSGGTDQGKTENCFGWDKLDTRGSVDLHGMQTEDSLEDLEATSV